MQEAIGLPGAVVDRHAGFDEVFPHLSEFDTDMFGHRIFSQWLDAVSSEVRFKPDRHRR
jgi:hypothetical protein